MNRARLFYWMTFFFGTAGVYYAAPLARPYFAASSAVRGGSAEQAEHDVAETQAVSSDTPVPSSARSDVSEPSAQAATPSSSTLPANTTPHVPAAAANRSASTADDDDDFIAPALNGVYVASARETPAWGITIKTVTYYKLDGSNQGSLPPGVLLLCKSAHSSSRGTMIECMIQRDDHAIGPYLIARKEALFMSGTPEALSRRQRAVLIEYYTLVSQIEQRKKELIEKDAAVNPFVPAARRAYDAFLKNLDEAKKVAAARDAAQGLLRTKQEDKLRQLKFEEMRLKGELDKAQAKLREWKAKNPDKVSNPDTDPTILAVLQQQKALADKIPGLAY